MNTNAIASKNNVITDPNTLIGKTGWTYGQAVEEVIASGGTVDLEIFPFAKSMLGITGGDEVESEDTIAKFERETGWSMSDALEEAVETQRDRRLFGTRPY